MNDGIDQMGLGLIWNIPDKVMRVLGSVSNKMGIDVWVPMIVIS